MVYRNNLLQDMPKGKINKPEDVLLQWQHFLICPPHTKWWLPACSQLPCVKQDLPLLGAGCPQEGQPARTSAHQDFSQCPYWPICPWIPSGNKPRYQLCSLIHSKSNYRIKWCQIYCPCSNVIYRMSWRKMEEVQFLSLSKAFWNKSILICFLTERRESTRWISGDHHWLLECSSIPPLGGLECAATPS